MTRRLLKDLSKQPLQLALFLVLTISQVLLTTYLPILIGQAVDRSLLPDAGRQIWQLLGKMLGLVLANTVLQYALPLVYNHLIFSYISDLRERLMATLHRLPIARVERYGIGDMITRLTLDTEQLSKGLLLVFQQYVSGVLTLLITIGIMAKLDLVLLLLVLLLTPASLGVAQLIAQKSYRFHQQEASTRGQQAEWVEEQLRQQTLTQLLNAQDEAMARFTDLNDQYAEASLQATFYASLVNPATRLVNALIHALLLAVGIYRMMIGMLTIGELTAFLNYVSQYTKPFNDISAVLAELQGALACANRLYQILAEDTLPPTLPVEDFSLVKGAVRFEEVSFSYDHKKPAIDHLTFSIPAGSQVAIVGQTGSGKTTLINLLMGFYEVDSGQIWIDDLPITALPKAVLRQQVGLVLQETWLKDATIHDNIAYGKPDASRSAVIAAAKAANADFFIRQLPKGYDTLVTEASTSLSQGQRQLLAIARVFLSQPRLLILDEATSSIDGRTESLIQEALQELMKGRTSLIIAHRLSTIRQADTILVMDQGRVIEQGNHETLLAQKGAYAQLYQAHF